MLLSLPSVFRVKPEIIHAIQHGSPVVALESAVITHGLPPPWNHELAVSAEKILREKGVVPATVAIINGKLCIGLDESEISLLANSTQCMKISIANIGEALNFKCCGGTTVAATLLAIRQAGIDVFATGGIGGVHRGNPFDISTDLEELSHSRVIVVCAGAKVILDLPATLEALETRGVPVLGYQTEVFPAFYSRTSGLPVTAKIDSPEMIAKIALAHWNVGNSSAVLVANPVPVGFALDGQQIEITIERAVKSAQQEGIRGSAVTPYLLNSLLTQPDGKSLSANVALLRNNVNLAGDIALTMHKRQRSMI